MRKVRNIKINDINNENVMNKIERLSSENNGVNLIFSIENYDDAFVNFANYCIELLKKAGVTDYTFSILTFDETIENQDLNVFTRVLKTDELENLIKVESNLPKTSKIVILEKYYSEKHYFDLANTIQAHELINNYADYINSLNLSPFEKYLMAYMFSTGFTYYDGVTKERDEYLPRLLVSSLNNVDEFVCCAFSNVFSNILKRVGIDSTIQHLKIMTDIKNNVYDFHVNNLVMLEDQKYGINGMIMADACNDSDFGKFYSTRKKGTLFNPGGERTLTYSAININDFQDTSDTFKTDDCNFLKLLYTTPEILLSDNYDLLFNCLTDDYIFQYLKFFTKNYSNYLDVTDLNIDLKQDEIDVLSSISIDVANLMGDVLGDDFIVASAVEKQDLGQQDYTILPYYDDVNFLFEQLVVLKFYGIDDEEMKQYLVSRKPEIMKKLKYFDEEYAVDNLLQHNKKIAERYANNPTKVMKLNVRTLFSQCSGFSSSRAFSILFLFGKRDRIFELINDIRNDSPVLEITDYISALSTILSKQGYPKEKIIGYVNHLMDLTVLDSSNLYDEMANNCFSRVFFEELENNSKKTEE